MTNSTLPASEVELSLVQKAWRYFYRSLRLRCPVCGISPLFKPVHQVRSIKDWFDILEGCPHCNYTFDREPGYFMAALWMFDYGFAAIFGIGLLLFLYANYQLSTVQMLLFVLVPTFLIALLMVRHAKAFWLALDHYFFH